MNSLDRTLTLAVDAPRGARHATWLELFFDLVFVVAVSNLARLLLDTHSLTGTLTFAALFVPVWWAWIGISYFLDQFKLRDVHARLLMFSQIAFAIGLAVGLTAVPRGEPTLFAASYLAMRVVLTALYAWAWRRVPGGEELNGKYTLAFTLGSAVWAASLLVDAPTAYVLWGVSLALEITGTIWAYVSARVVPAQVSHMDERFGLFTILVLGESILAVATGSAHVENAAGWVVAACGLALACGAWWLYFDYADDRVIDRALRSGRRALYRSFVYGYTHLFVFASIVAAAIGVELAIEDLKHAEAGEGTRLLLCGGLALYLVALSVVQRAEPCLIPRSVLIVRGVAVLAWTALGVLGGALGALALTMLVTSTLVLVVVFERFVNPEASGEGEATALER